MNETKTNLFLTTNSFPVPSTNLAKSPAFYLSCVALILSLGGIIAGALILQGARHSGSSLSRFFGKFGTQTNGALITGIASATTLSSLIGLTIITHRVTNKNKCIEQANIQLKKEIEAEFESLKQQMRRNCYHLNIDNEIKQLDSPSKAEFLLKKYTENYEDCPLTQLFLIYVLSRNVQSDNPDAVKKNILYIHNVIWIIKNLGKEYNNIDLYLDLPIEISIKTGNFEILIELVNFFQVNGNRESAYESLLTKIFKVYKDLAFHNSNLSPAFTDFIIRIMDTVCTRLQKELPEESDLFFQLAKDFVKYGYLIEPTTDAEKAISDSCLKVTTYLDKKFDQISIQKIIDDLNETHYS